MNKKGFTLIELIIVVAIIALLAAATFVAVNPAKRIGEAQDAQRWSDVTAIADAYMKYAVDNSGSYVTSTTNGATYHIATTTGGTHSASHCTATTTTNYSRVNNWRVYWCRTYRSYACIWNRRISYTILFI